MTGAGNESTPPVDDEPVAALPAAFVITSVDAGLRLDHFLTGRYPEYTRSALNKLIAASLVLVDGSQVKAGYRLRERETVTVVLPAPEPLDLTPEKIEFSVLHEDAHILVINKPPGLVVHPAGGHRSGTLVHGLLHLCRELPAADAGRPGIVHRLDKDTSGVMLVAKTELALRVLMADFKDRKIHKTYHALLLRCPRDNEGRVSSPIGRHPVDRKKMAVRPVHGKHAATNWRVLERFANGWGWAEIEIETGRTHQIRVHMASIKSPVAGDALYGGSVDRRAIIRPLRQMLHASTLRFRHPVNGETLRCTAPLAEDMQQVLTALRGIGS
ncbi:MAG: RluA family pseudouridine synthase [Desulfobulbus sp.]|jgi:23S rRNA pseudouridine1911/1915/1917 synthase|uniref:RluA family pseudouridine synthase n=1 Tax=Desulfobulbus sp. TaxID=895 RepID=UPI00283AFAF3|nr:RluA family pseudouridine synthase [Desulfobulbus sp.]MDR2550825.1 RluA family pseudouridine synthase [Desulfobulbus sp.]